MKKKSYKELQKLFNRIKQGDDDAFRELYECSFNSQYFLAYNYTKNKYLAEEAVQNMYIRFYKNLDSINNSMAIIKWMNVTTINECKNLLRKENNNKNIDIENYKDELIDTNPNPEESYRRGADKDILNQALDKLEPELKEVIIYRYVDNLKIGEIAELASMSTATVNRYIKTGTMKLKNYIKHISNNLYSITFAPLVLKLFNKTMDSQISDRHISDLFDKTFKSGSVAGAGGAALGTTMVSKVKKKSAKKIFGIIGASTATVAAGVAVVATTIIPSFRVYMINSNGYLLNQKLFVSSNDYDKIKNIICYKDDAIVGEFNSDNEYTIDIYDNGTYTIAVKDKTGSTHKKNVTINNIDYTCPDIDVVKSNDMHIATIKDDGCGVDYNTLKIEDDAKEITDYTVFEDTVTFFSSEPTITISVADKLGNTKRLVIKNNK